MPSEGSCATDFLPLKIYRSRLGGVVVSVLDPKVAG
jgi:hypothetical protein